MQELIQQWVQLAPYVLVEAPDCPDAAVSAELPLALSQPQVWAWSSLYACQQWPGVITP